MKAFIGNWNAERALGHALSFALTLGTLGTGFACAPREPRSQRDPSAETTGGETSSRVFSAAENLRDTHVVLIAIDGVRWQDVFLGVDRNMARARNVSAEHVVGASELMPNLHALIATRGAALGAPGRGAMAASGPNYVSTPGYMEMLLGRRPPPCGGNQCGAVSDPTLLNELAALPGARRGDIAVVSSWDGIGKTIGVDDSRVVATVGRHQGRLREAFGYDPVAKGLLKDGVSAGPEPGVGDFRRDAETAAIALRYFEKRRPNFLFVGLGEPDEYAHVNDYESYLKSLKSADRVIGRFAGELFALERSGKRCVLLITTDHGRAEGFTDHGKSDPESAFVWLVAAGDAIRARGFAQAPEPRYLADIAPTLRAVLGLPHDPALNAGQVLHELLLPNRSDPQRLAGSNVCLPCLDEPLQGLAEAPRDSE
jgi:hypothetical protein